MNMIFGHFQLFNLYLKFFSNPPYRFRKPSPYFRFAEPVPTLRTPY